MNCQDITDNLDTIRKLYTSFQSDFNSRKYSDAFALRRDIESWVELILEERDPDQIRKRDRIAKKLGLAWLGKFHEGLAWGKTNTRLGSLLLVSSDGELIPHFASSRLSFHAGDFKDGSAWVEFPEGTSQNFWMPVDRDGVENNNTRYRSLDLTSEDIYPASIKAGQNNYVLVLVKHNGEKLSVEGIDKFYFVTPFHDRRAWVREIKAGPYKLIDAEGRVIAVRDNYDVVQPFSEGKSLVHDKDRDTWDIILPDGGSTISRMFPARHAGEFHEGVLKVEHVGGGYGFYILAEDDLCPLKIGVPGIGRDEYKEASDFHDGLTRVTKLRTVGTTRIPVNFYINKAEKDAFDRNFELCEDFSEGAAAVIPSMPVAITDADAYLMYIGTDGKPLFPGDTFEDAKRFFTAGPFKDGIALVQDYVDQSAYYIDKKGRKVFV